MPIVTTHVIYVLTSFMRYAFSQYLKKKQIFSLVDYVHVYFIWSWRFFLLCKIVNGSCM